MTFLPPIVITVPADTLWLDAEGVGRMIGYEARVVRERLAGMPGFPQPVRIEGKGDRRWNAREVHEWMLAQRESRPGRKRAA
jgi:hypothetical protein